MAGRFRNTLFPKYVPGRASGQVQKPPPPQEADGRPWYRRKLVAIPLAVFAGLLVIGAVGNLVDPPKKTVVRADGGTVNMTSTTVDGRQTAPVPPTTVPPAAFPDARTKTSLCRYNGPLPDHACTPGALNPAVSQATIAETICTSGFTAAVRPVATDSERMKQQAGLAYGVTDPLSQYQGDHLIPLELGGAAADLANFWVEPTRQVLADGTVVTSDEKDVLETTLKARVCSGQMTLLDAQRQIATDWYAAWTSVGRPLPTTSSSSTSTSTLAVTTTVVATTRPPTTTAPVPPVITSPPTTAANCPNGTYVNVSGNTVCSPYAAPTAPAGATAQCNDGTYSMSQHRQGTCSSHDGVRSWLVDLP